MNYFKKFGIASFPLVALLAIFFVAHSQTSPVTGPVATSQTPYGLQFAQAYYAAQNPIKLPFYNGLYGGPSATPLSQTQENTLIQTCINAKVLIDEQIDYWHWDPLTVMQMRVIQGIGWVPSGLGPAICTSVLQSGCVITPGMYSGTPPAGSIPTCTQLSCYPSWPVNTTPTMIQTSVGPQIAGPYYEVIGTVPPMGTVSGKCTLAQIPNQSPFATGSLMNVWNCTN